MNADVLLRIYGAKVNLRTTRRRFAASLSMICAMAILVPVLLANADAITNIRVEPAANVDERLFLLRLLDVMYEQFPTGVQDRNKLTQTIADLRSRAKRFEQHIRRNDLGDDLAGLYSDYAEVLDAYVSFLIQIDKLQSGAVDRANTEAFKNGFSSGVEGAGVYTAATEAGAERSDATIAALLVGGVRFLVKQYEQSKTLEEGKREAIQAAQQAFETKVETAFSTLKEVAAALTTRYEWGKGETGLLMSEAEAQRFKEVMGGKDDRAIIKMLEDLTSARPRDPFVRNLRNATVLVSSDTTVGKCLRAAKDSASAACLVPKGSIYDEYRASTLYLR